MEIGCVIVSGEGNMTYANLLPFIEINLELTGYSIIEDSTSGNSQFKLIKGN